MKGLQQLDVYCLNISIQAVEEAVLIEWELQTMEISYILTRDTYVVRVGAQRDLLQEE